MTWDAYHRRNDALRQIAAVADRRRDGALPWGELEAARAAFETPSDLLLALHMRWHTRLRAHVDRELEEHPVDLETATARAWRNAVADLPGTRAILDTHGNDPGLAVAQQQELAFLSGIAGLAAAADPGAAEHGRRIVHEAAAISVERQRPDTNPRTGLMRRVRQALVA